MMRVASNDDHYKSNYEADRDDDEEEEDDAEDEYDTFYDTFMMIIMRQGSWKQAGASIGVCNSLSLPLSQQ